MSYFGLLKHRLVGTAAAVLLSAATGTVVAAPCTGTNVANASTDDVTLGGFDSDHCVVSNTNAQAGPNGDTSGFDVEFGGGWSLLTKIDSGGSIAPNPATVDGVTFSVGFTKNPDNVSGTWSLSTDVGAMFDLVFAMHAGGHTGAFLFDDEVTLASVAKSGDWVIEWVNNGGQIPDYSNLTLFVRDIAPVMNVPEPATYLLLAMTLSGLAGLSRRGRRIR